MCVGKLPPTQESSSPPVSISADTVSTSGILRNPHGLLFSTETVLWNGPHSPQASPRLGEGWQRYTAGPLLAGRGGRWCLPCVPLRTGRYIVKTRLNNKVQSCAQPVLGWYRLRQRVRIMCIYSGFRLYLLILLQLCQSRGGIISDLCRSSP